MKRSKTTLLFLSILLQSLALADEVPSASQLELSFELSEAIRSPLAAGTMFVVPKVLPFGAQMLGLEGGPMMIAAMAPPSWLAGYLGFSGVQNYKKNKFLQNILKECEGSKIFLCVQDETGKISFLNPETKQEVGFIHANRKAAVIEVGSNPFKLKDVDLGMGKILESSLYEASKSSGLRNVIVGGKSPIRFEFESMFGGGKSKQAIDYRFFRNYVVDWANHDELYYGALHYSPGKGGAHPLLDTDQKRSAFKNWLNNYDSHLKNGSMNEEVFQSMRKSLETDCKFGKGAALNVYPTPDAIEVNSLRTNKNLEDLTRKLNILESRARFIHAQEKLIPYYESGSIQSAQEGVNRFHLYLKESGLDWEQYKKVLPQNWQKKTPQTLPTEQLFASGETKPSMCFRALTRTMIHLFGK